MLMLCYAFNLVLLTDAVQDTDTQMRVENSLLLLNECCKLVSDNLRDDVLVKRLDEFEFKACRASIELEEMDKELSACPVMMRAYVSRDLTDLNCSVFDSEK